MDILMRLDFWVFWKRFLFYLKPLENFEFSFSNPLFWILWLLLLLILLRKWETKKAVYFCSLVAFILLCTTYMQSRFVTLFPGPNPFFDTNIIKLISAIVVVLLFLFYVFWV